LTSLFPFIAGLKTDLPEQAAQIDALLESESIAVINDDYGTGRTDAGQSTDGSTPAEDKILPIYKPLTVNGPAVNVCSSDAYRSPVTDAVNKLGSRAFLRFTAPVNGRYLLKAVTTSMPSGDSADPDMIVHGGEAFPPVRSENPPDEAVCSPDLPPAGCSETLQSSLGSGDYVLEVYEWTNTQDGSGDRPPIGLTCFDVTVAAQ
ncbi:MAG TPA: hypothetical protein VFY39_01350, partial [Gammaproteobacteria bacterium]|nr:hypothetical protein [Gammaproteobacteria bacterium]